MVWEAASFSPLHIPLWFPPIAWSCTTSAWEGTLSPRSLQNKLKLNRIQVPTTFPRMSFFKILDLLTRLLGTALSLHPCAGTEKMSMEGGQRELLSQLCSLAEPLSNKQQGSGEGGLLFPCEILNASPEHWDSLADTTSPPKPPHPQKPVV